MQLASSLFDFFQTLPSVGELDIEHLGTLLKLRYGDSLPDAIKDLGGVEATRAAFTGFQRRLYEPLTAA